MADLIHRTQRDYRGYLLRLFSVNTPNYGTNDWLVNPDLSDVSGVDEKYWKVTGVAPAGSVEEMDAGEKLAVDNNELTSAKATRKAQLIVEKENYVSSRYTTGIQSSFNSLSKRRRKKPNRGSYLSSYYVWLEQVDQELSTKQADVDAASDVSSVNAVSLDTATLDGLDPGVSLDVALGVTDDNSLDSFVDTNAAVTDSLTSINGEFLLMQALQNRRELFNDVENPLYHASVTPILGAGGYLVDHANRILNIENIHNKNGWHGIQVQQALYKRPKDLLIYYGYPNSFNSGSNGWSNEAVAQDMAKYNLIVLGNGIQEASHPDYTNTTTIVPRIKALNPRAKIFGYVSVDQAQGTIETSVDGWDTLGVHGIFLDEAGYDFGVDRSAFNTAVDYVHGKTTANVCFANAWNIDHVLGTDDDVSFPNSTYNPTAEESSLTNADWILLESLAVNTTAYSGNDGYESGSQWYTRVVKATNLRATYGVNMAGSCVIANGDAEAQNLFNFAFVSSLMNAFDGFGSSDTNYGAGATVTYWARPSVEGIGTVWELYPGVQQDVSDSDVYHRYSESAKMSLDFSSGAHSSTITKY